MFLEAATGVRVPCWISTASIGMEDGERYRVNGNARAWLSKIIEDKNKRMEFKCLIYLGIGSLIVFVKLGLALQTHFWSFRFNLAYFKAPFLAQSCTDFELYLLPPSLGKGHLSHNLGFSEAASVSHDLKIVGLADAVEARINVKVNNRQMFRCALRRSPSSSLANDSITAMAEGLSPSLYNHFLALLWGDGDSGYLSEANSTVDSEWNSFCDTIMQMCKKSSVVSQELPKSPWEFLLNSKFHKNYCQINSMIGLSSRAEHDRAGSDSMRSNIDGAKGSEKSFYSDLLMESLDSLHAVYESLKMDNLRRR
ncbi:hypothetical protein DITRI_Ditri02bG0124600 [Diplodiscus trichospermus]